MEISRANFTLGAELAKIHTSIVERVSSGVPDADLRQHVVHDGKQLLFREPGINGRPGFVGRVANATSIVIEDIATPDNIWGQEQKIIGDEIPARVIKAHLYYHSSPYTREEEVNEKSTDYWIVAGPDMPSVMMHTSVVEKVAHDPKALPVPALDTVGRVQQELGDEALHYLSSQDCATILRAVAKFQPDVGELIVRAHTDHRSS